MVLFLKVRTALPPSSLSYTAVTGAECPALSPSESCLNFITSLRGKLVSTDRSELTYPVGSWKVVLRLRRSQLMVASWQLTNSGRAQAGLVTVSGERLRRGCRSASI